jgi:hypothetical protein
VSGDHGTGCQLPTGDELPDLPPLTTERCAELLAAATKLPYDIAAMLIDPTWRQT